MIQEYAVVRLRRAMPTIPLRIGTKGAILVVHHSNPPAYEVEFVDDDGKSLGTYTVEEVYLEEVKGD